MHTLSTSTLDKAPIEASTAASPLGSRLKSALLFTGAQCSFFIGAGIATGQESLQYFTAHGWWGIVSIVLVVLLFSWLLSSLTEWGRKNRDNKADPFTDICGKTVGTVLRYCVPVFVFMIAVTMFAGAGALLSDVLGTPTWVGATGMAVVVAITLMFGFRNLVEIIGRIGPVIVIVIGIVALWVVVENFAALADVPKNLAQYQPAKASENWFIGTILYSTAILIIAVPFLTSLGREDRSLRSTVRPSILTGFLYGGVMGLCALALLATLPMVYNEATPLVMLGIDLAPWLGYVFSIITLLGIYSTAAPMLWTVADQFPLKSRRTYAIVCLALTVVALIGGLKLPFAELVGFVYPSIGYFGLVFFGCLAYRQIKSRLAHR